MLALLIVLFVLVIALTVVLWVGSLFAQNYLYTSPAPGIYWKAALAALCLAGFYLIWSLLNIQETTTSPLGVVEIPYGLIWEFSPWVDVIPEPVPEFVSKRRTSEPAVYKLDKSLPPGIKYRKADSDEFWNAGGTEYIEFKHAGKEYKFVPDKTRGEGYVVFVDADTGLEMKETQIGKVGYTSWVRLLVYFALNVTHLVLWVTCLWLFLGFEFWHSFGLGFLLWLLATAVILPGIFEHAAAV